MEVKTLSKKAKSSVKEILVEEAISKVGRLSASPDEIPEIVDSALPKINEYIQREYAFLGKESANVSRESVITYYMDELC